MRINWYKWNIFTFTFSLLDDSYEGNDDESDSPEDESSESKSGGEKFDAMIVGSDSEDDKDYVPPKSKFYFIQRSI